MCRVDVTSRTTRNARFLLLSAKLEVSYVSLRGVTLITLRGIMLPALRGITHPICILAEKVNPKSMSRILHFLRSHFPGTIKPVHASVGCRVMPQST